MGESVSRAVRQSVSRSVRQSVSYQLFSELGRYFFLIFFLKLGVHKGSKVTEPDFSGKIWFGWFLVKRPKMTVIPPHSYFFAIFSKLSHCSRPIRLQDSFNDYISWRSWYLTLIFCMQVDIHERKKPSVTLWGVHAQACPGMPDFARFYPRVPWALWRVPCTWKWLKMKDFMFFYGKNLVWLIFRKKTSKNGCYFAPNLLFHYSFKIGSLDFSDIMHEVRGV